MIRLLGKIPNDNFYVACSGGVDSMVILDFLFNGGYKPKVAHFDHLTEHGAQARTFVREQCKKYGVEMHVDCPARKRDVDESQEEYWRNERYRFFESLDGPVITAHHLDDAVEWWLFTSMHGWPKLIPYERNNVIRPFLLTEKEELRSWAVRKGVEVIEDPSNHDTKYMRNLIRHRIVPNALVVNPGLRKVVRKEIQKENIYKT
jgi:tRNA(Ile)-lysidine synthase